MPDVLSTDPHSLFARLKIETAAQHQALETEVNPLLRFENRAEYAAYLRRALGFYRGMEKELARFDWRELGLDFETRRKTPWLERDLAVLETKPPFVETESPAKSFASRAAAIGGMYVLEGATLGGQIISRHLAKLGITPHQGGAFFHGYGERTGAMWKTFREAASQGCRTESEINEAVAAARWTFDQFAQWVPESGPTR